MPMDYFHQLLGKSDDDSSVCLKSPFDTDNRLILVANNVSTKYVNRECSYEKIIKYIKLTIQAKVGNYLVFFPSYEYMNAVYNVLAKEDMDMDVYIQNPSMSEEERDSFLKLFKPNQTKSTLVFGVLGGLFSEGIDLTNDRLIGTIIVGVGLPAISFERNIIRSYFEEKNHMGYEYSYMYPGMNKVLQAAGRVIRTEKDRGVILLIDERFTTPGYERLYPAEWFPYKVVNYNNIMSCLKEFWENRGR